MSFDSLLNKTATIERVTTTADTVGGQVKDWATLIASVPCAIQPVGAKEQAALGNREVLITHIMYCRPFSAEVTEADRVNAGGTYYDINGITDEAGRGHHYKVYLTERKDG
jgi:SPP1 family predicted phage head-tail adaptor